jgi:predicted alpha/beta superfamily hydrolase
MKLDKFLLPSRKLGNARTIRVYYPEDKSKRYPVLYVHDGEFCFRKDTPADYESMELDLALEKTGKQLIIVTIEAMHWQIRTREYSPFRGSEKRGSICPKVKNWGRSTSIGSSMKLNRLSISNTRHYQIVITLLCSAAH